MSKAESKPEHSADPLIGYTIFKNLWPKSQKDMEVRKGVRWSELVRFIEDQENVHYTNKKDCPLISLCSYGSEKTEKGVLRHASNVRKVYGVEIDYDGEQMTPAEAQKLLRDAGIRAVIYTSPSHRPEHPRWRALLPLSKPHAPEDRARMVGKVNAALGGVVSRESFTLSQSFYIGHVRNAEYLVYETHGKPVDRVKIEPQMPGGTETDEEYNPQFDATPDEVFIESYEKGEGRYDATLALTSRWVSRGINPEKVRARLKKFVYHAERDGVAPKTAQGEDLYKTIDRLVDSAVKKYGVKKEAEDQEPQEDEFWLDVSSFSEPAEPPKFVINGWLSYPNVSLYSAHGGSGKSSIALEICVRVALGMSVFGEECRQGPVFYISAEDDRDVIHHRLQAILKSMGVPASRLQGKLFIRDATQDDTILFHAPERFGEEPYVTPRFRLLRKLIKKHDPVFVVLDNAIDHYAGNENNRTQVRTFIRRLHGLSKLGSGRNIMLLAHVDASTLKDGEKGKGFSGSTAWHNSVRNLWYQFREGDVNLLTLRKINYARPGAVVKIEWDDEHGKFSMGKTITPNTMVNKNSFRILRIVVSLDNEGIPMFSEDSKKGNVVAKILAHPLCPDELKTAQGPRAVRAAIKLLRQDGLIEEVQGLDRNRHPRKYLKPTKEGRLTASNTDEE